MFMFVFMRYRKGMSTSSDSSDSLELPEKNQLVGGFGKDCGEGGDVNFEPAKKVFVLIGVTTFLDGL